MWVWCDLLALPRVELYHCLVNQERDVLKERRCLIHRLTHRYNDLPDAVDHIRDRLGTLVGFEVQPSVQTLCELKGRCEHPNQVVDCQLLDVKRDDHLNCKELSSSVCVCVC